MSLNKIFTDLDAQMHRVVGLTTPTSDFHAANKKYVDDNVAAGGISASTIDAKGDIIVGTADNSVDNLPVGTDGQVLTADSTETMGIKWLSTGTEWVEDSETWTYASATTFTIAGVDRTEKFSPGTRIRLKQGAGYLYFVVASSTFSTNTTVTITGGSDYTLANSSITDNYFSYVSNPQGYPGWFNFTCGATGFSSKTVDAGRFSVNGRVCFVEFEISGTSNATTFAWVLPISSSSSARNTFAGSGTSVNSGATGTSPARVNVPAGTTTATMGRQWSGDGGYTASGTKGSQGIITYEI